MKTIALCGVCGQPVEYAYYEKGVLNAEEGHAICSEGGVVYHYERGRDCYGKYTGFDNFLTMEEKTKYLDANCCPNCINHPKLKRKSLKDFFSRTPKLYCQRCGFSLSNILIKKKRD